MSTVYKKGFVTRQKFSVELIQENLFIIDVYRLGLFLAENCSFANFFSFLFSCLFAPSGKGATQIPLKAYWQNTEWIRKKFNIISPKKIYLPVTQTKTYKNNKIMFFSSSMVYIKTYWGNFLPYHDLHILNWQLIIYGKQTKNTFWV